MVFYTTEYCAVPLMLESIGMDCVISELCLTVIIIIKVQFYKGIIGK